MSHFYLITLIPDNVLLPVDPTDSTQWTEEGTRYATTFIQDQMARYCEGRDVDEYDRTCSCVNWAASMAARQRANEVLSMDEARSLLQQRTAKELPEVHAHLEKEGHTFNLSEELSEKYEALWSEILRPQEEAQEVFCKAHPLHNKPDTECEECKGSGTVRSTYNPESKWDWYRIGGRWAGEIQKKRLTSVDHGFNFDAACEALHRNAMTVSAVLTQWEPTDAPLAILTPDGEWHEKGAMGWFGVFKCSPHDTLQWREAAKKILELHPNCLAVGIDCHV